MRELERLGFVWSVNDWKFERTLTALRTYAELHGDLCVNKRFDVPPEAPWDRGLWGFPLGRAVGTLRATGAHELGGRFPERLAALSEMGFVWDDNERRWQNVLMALRAYSEIYGDLEVAKTFVVPANAPWPEPSWGMKLGSRVSDIRSVGAYGAGSTEKRAALDELGFVWNHFDLRWGEVYAALRAYRDMNGDLQVPIAFVVPAEAPWPEQVWGMRLGKRVHIIRACNTYVERRPERRRQLDELGFVWGEHHRRWTESCAALKVYGEICGDLKVPAHFVVPSEAPWPAQHWGMPLGERVIGIRQGRYVEGCPARREQLDALGFVWSVSDRTWEEVHAVLQAYRDLHGDLFVPNTFVVPSEAPWPEVAWGLKLGVSVWNIRHRGSYVNAKDEGVKRRAQLDRLGFVWRAADATDADGVTDGGDATSH
eukprot:g2301.t1